jgi:hypothetical protein
MCSTNCKYLEAAPNTWSGGAEDPLTSWSTGANQSLSVTGARQTAIGTGYQNSLAIVAQSGNLAETSAAVAARAYTGGGKDDWYLPSIDELDLLFLQRAIIGGFTEATNYWTSSEFDDSDARYIYFPYNDQDRIGSNAIKADPTLYVRPVRAFAPALSTISIANVVIPAPVRGATPASSLASNGQYTAAITWSGSPTTFAAAKTYTATITLTPTAGFTLTGVTANFFTVAGTSIPATNATNSGTISAVFPATSAPAPVSVPYLKTLTAPKTNLNDGKLVCTPGTYNAGFTLDGVIQGSSTALFSPSSFIYNLLINGVVQTALATVSSNTSNSWNTPLLASGSLITCSVTVSVNGVTNTDRSSDNASSVSSALSTQTAATSAANAVYTAALLANDKVYQKALVDNRAKWRTDIEKIRNDYYAERDRIRLLPSTKATRALASTALKVYTAAQKKSAADYKASQPAALAAKDSANKAALDANKAAIARANATYGTFIESIGYGVLIP